jgi:hypothetical protein
LEIVSYSQYCGKKAFKKDSADNGQNQVITYLQAYKYKAHKLERKRGKKNIASQIKHMAHIENPNSKWK